jgi:CRISPR-associated endonuclease/helicase Cas3
VIEGRRHLRYWAKKAGDGGYHPVLYHCLDVSAAARAILEKRPRSLARLAGASGLPAETLLDFVPLLLSFHDLGKLADGFQCQDPALMAKLQGACRQAPYDRELFRHDSLGYAILAHRLASALPNLIPEPLWRCFAATWLSAAMGHHGRPPVVHAEKQVLQLDQIAAEVAADLDETLRNLQQLFLPGGLKLPAAADLYDLEDSWTRASWLFAGLAVLADWLGSNVQHFPPSEEDRSPRDYYERVALPAAVRAVEEAGLAEQRLSPPKTFGELWPGYRPTPLQELAAGLELGSGPHLIVIEEVTGGGKTEAAFTLAHRLVAAGAADGLYFGLPTMATANAMHDRIRATWLALFAEGAQPSMVLAHAKRHLRLDQLAEAARRESRESGESAAEQCAAWLSDSRKKALLAEVGVGTIDQALLAVLQARHQSLRIWGLAGKVLVVDEVHAADAYMQGLLRGLLEAHAACGSSAILLSATLPAGQRAALVRAFARGAGCLRPALPACAAYPVLLHFAGGEVQAHPVAARAAASRRIAVRLWHLEEEVDALLLSTLEAGGCACWVRNTVGDAIAAFRRWSALWGEARVELFHARFTVTDRHRLEEDVLDRFGTKSGPAERAGRLLIATQVVEQSLDLDFDTLVSDLAPADLLVQRAGRLRRHERSAAGERVVGPDERGEAVLHVFSPPPADDVPANWFSSFLPGAARIYPDHGQLWAGARWLVDRGGFRVPEDLRDLIEAVYSPQSQLEPPSALTRHSERAEGKARADSAIAAGNLIDFGNGYAPSGQVSTWRDDVSTSTRLGDPTVVLRLALVDNGEARPFHPGPQGWELSEVGVRQALVAAEAETDAAAIERAKATMADQGKWILLILLRPEGDGWRGAARRLDGRPVAVLYSARRGLETIRDPT